MIGHIWIHGQLDSEHNHSADDTIVKILFSLIFLSSGNEIHRMFGTGVVEPLDHIGSITLYSSYNPSFIAT